MLLRLAVAGAAGGPVSYNCFPPSIQTWLFNKTTAAANADAAVYVSTAVTTITMSGIVIVVDATSQLIHPWKYNQSGRVTLGSWAW